MCVQSPQNAALRPGQQQIVQLAHDERRPHGDLPGLVQQFRQPQHAFHEIRVGIGHGHPAVVHAHRALFRRHLHEQLSEHLPVQMKEEGKEGPFRRGVHGMGQARHVHRGHQTLISADRVFP